MAMAFARAVGEYGSVVFISGNLPGKTEIAPLLIMTRLEEFNYPAATAVAVVMLLLSFVLLLLINALQAWARRSATATSVASPSHRSTIFAWVSRCGSSLPT